MNSQQKRSKKKQLEAKFGSYCYWCRRYFPINELTIDHLIPKSLGGSDSIENLRLSCKNCNQERGNSLFPPPTILNSIIKKRCVVN